MADLDRVIQSLYAAAFEGEGETFRPHALAELCHWLGASGAAWLTRSTAGLVGEFTEHPAGSGVSAAQLAKLDFSDGVREYDLDPLPPELAPAGAAAREHGHLLHYAHRGGGLHSVLLIRSPRSRKLQHAGEVRRAAGHMIEAGTLALRKFINRDERLDALGRANRGSAALVDAHGTIYAASKHFCALLSEVTGHQQFTVLPYPLPEEALGDAGEFRRGEMHFRVARHGQLYLLHARRPVALDSLSPREQQIARALGTGKTFKSVARQFDIAVSTVANHASRIYKKLGIFRREELVEKVRSPGS